MATSEERRAPVIEKCKEMMKAADPLNASRRTGFEYSYENRGFLAVFLDDEYSISYPECRVECVGSRKIPESPIPELLCAYLIEAKSEEVSGDRIPFREIKGAMFQERQFIEEIEKPLGQALTGKAKNLAEWAKSKGLLINDEGDVAFKWNILPYYPVYVKFYDADEEFSSEVKILFDSCVKEKVSSEITMTACELMAKRIISDLGFGFEQDKPMK